MAVNQGSLIVGGIVAVGDYLIYSHFVGASAADIKTAEPFDVDIEKSERSALYACIAFTTVVAVLARSKEVFIIGGVATLFADFGLKHANAVSPNTHQMVNNSGASLGGTNEQSYPLPDYSESDQTTAAGS